MRKCWYLFLTLIPLSVGAQQANPDIRSGNRDFRSGKSTEAEVSYRKALQQDPHSVEATFNMGNSLYAQGKVKEASEAYEKAASMTDDKRQLARICHNLGNCYYQQKAYDKSVASYKRALKANPKDEDTRHNLAMALKQLQQQSQPQSQQQQQQEQQQEQQQQQPPQPQQQQQQDISKENAQQILDAYQQQEQELKEKMQQQNGGQRNLEKDW